MTVRKAYHLILKFNFLIHFHKNATFSQQSVDLTELILLITDIRKYKEIKSLFNPCQGKILISVLHIQLWKHSGAFHILVLNLLSVINPKIRKSGHICML